MKIKICAVGRLRHGAEKDLISDYVTRFNRSAQGMGPIEIHEVEDKSGQGSKAEGKLLARAIPADSFVCCLDERGKVMTSPDFANQLTEWRDDGVQSLSFVIGGADGLDDAIKSSANYSLSFGKMVWPHMLVRVMLTEQLYRAASIMNGSPYHRV